jgi:hypothetical protein
MNYRIHKTLAFVAMGLTVAGLLGLFGINLTEKAFDMIPWKFVLIIAQGYTAFVFNKLLNG